MYIKTYPNKDKTDKAVYIFTSKPGKKKSVKLESYPSWNKLKEEHNDVDAFLSYRMKELEKQANQLKAEYKTVTIDIHKKHSFDGDDISLCKNAGYLFLQKAYFELLIDPSIRKWKHDNNYKIHYSLPDAVKLLAYERVINPCSKLATSKLSKNFLENYDLSVDDLYDSLDRIDTFSERLTKRLSSACASKLGIGDTVYYDCTNFYFEIENADDEKGLRDYGVEKNHRPDPIVEYGLLLNSNGYPIGSKTFRGNESEKTSMVSAMLAAGDEATAGKIIVADAGLNTSANKDAIHSTGRNYIFAQSPKTISEDNLVDMFDDKGWIEYDNGKKKVKSYWIQRGKGVEERLVVRFDKASYDYMNHVIDTRVERAKKYTKHPTTAPFPSSQDGKQYLKKISVDKKTAEINELATVYEIDEEKIQEDRKYAGYTLFVTDIPREKDDEDGHFTKLKKEGYRVEFMDDIEILKIAGKRNDIESCFREMKSSLKARPIYVRKPEHIKAHLMIVYLALTLLMYIRAKYVPEMTSERLLAAIRNYTMTEFSADDGIWVVNYASNDVKELAKSIGLENIDRKYLTINEIKEMISSSKVC